MKRIYLDMNVFVAILKKENDKLLPYIGSLKATGYQFPYSPAHIEEAATILRDFDDPKEPEKAPRLVSENLELIGQISDHWELLPGLNDLGPSRYVQEDPVVCWQRVVGMYDRTYLAEDAQRNTMSRKSPEAFDAVQEEIGSSIRARDGVELFADVRKSLGIDKRGLGNLSESQVLQDARVLDALSRKIWNPQWTLETLPKGELLRHDHKTRERVVDLVMTCLDEVGYREEPFDRYRSAMHDITHAIYGAAVDALVTNDKKFRAKVKATYHFLGITTEVLSGKDFLDRYSTVD